jgi:hypothetical protein
MKKQFELSDINVLSQTIREYQTFCVDYGFKAHMGLSNLEDVMDVLINGIVAAPRAYWQLIPPTSISAAEFNEKVREADEERDRRETEARRLLMQVFHVFKRYPKMTFQSRDELEEYYKRRREIIPRITAVFTYALP